MTTVHFIRHARPDLSVHDDRTRPLSAEGLADCHLIEAYLSEKSLAAVLSSPYRRAMDTVGSLAHARRLAVLPVEDFRERRISDVWIEDFSGFARRQWADCNYKLPGGESLRETETRCIGALERILQQYAGQSVAVGIHGTALSCILHHFIPSFGYNDFCEISHEMPWIVTMAFEDSACVSITEYRVFSRTTRRLL